MTTAARRRPLGLLLLLSALAAGPADAQPRQPLEGAGEWQLSDRLPGVDERTCTARITGPDANITLVLNYVGAPVLMVGRSDWDNAGAEIAVGVAIDGAAPVALRGSAVATLVLVLVDDADVLARLRSARMLEWSFPFGRFRTNVTGLGAALDAIRSCQGAAPVAG